MQPAADLNEHYRNAEASAPALSGLPPEPTDRDQIIIANPTTPHNPFVQKTRPTQISPASHPNNHDIFWRALRPRSTRREPRLPAPLPVAAIR